LTNKFNRIKKPSITKLQSNIEQIQTRINYCDDEINRLVYELYSLEKPEIDMIEENAKNKYMHNEI